MARKDEEEYKGNLSLSTLRDLALYNSRLPCEHAAAVSSVTRWSWSDVRYIVTLALTDVTLVNEDTYEDDEDDKNKMKNLKKMKKMKKVEKVKKVKKM